MWNLDADNHWVALRIYANQTTCLLLLMAFELSIVHSVLNVKTLVGTFNQEKALVGAISFDREIFANLRLKL